MVPWSSVRSGRCYDMLIFLPVYLQHAGSWTGRLYLPFTPNRVPIRRLLCGDNNKFLLPVIFAESTICRVLGVPLYLRSCSCFPPPVTLGQLSVRPLPSLPPCLYPLLAASLSPSSSSPLSSLALLFLLFFLRRPFPCSLIGRETQGKSEMIKC